MKVMPVEFEVAKSVVEEFHYSGSLPTNCRHNFAPLCYRVRGICSFGPAVNKFIPEGWCELRRLVRIPDEKFVLSAFVSGAVRFLRAEKQYRAIISYADPGQGHHGGIYQACSWSCVPSVKESAVKGFRDESGAFVHRRTCYERFGTSSVPKILGINPGWTAVRADLKVRYIKGLSISDKEAAGELGCCIIPYPKPGLLA